MTWPLSAVPELTDVLRGVQRHFERGGTVGSVAAVILLLAALVLVVRLLARRGHSVQADRGRSDPQRLFRDVVARLPLTPPQRKSLMTMSKELRLAQPAVLLLSRVVFDRKVRTWQGRLKGRVPAGNTSTHEGHFAGIRAALFPEN
jgi:hypothetical protein